MKNFAGQTVWKTVANVYHLGDDVLGLEWNTKMGTIGGEVLDGIQKAISIAEEKYKGVVIANDSQNFLRCKRRMIFYVCGGAGI